MYDKNVLNSTPTGSVTTEVSKVKAFYLHWKWELYFYSTISKKTKLVHYDIYACFSTKELGSYKKLQKYEKIWFEKVLNQFSPQKSLF